MPIQAAVVANDSVSACASRPRPPPQMVIDGTPRLIGMLESVDPSPGGPEAKPSTVAAARPLRDEIDGAEQYRIQMEIDDQDLELGAIYHSHTRSEPVPSQTDINLAFYPDALYVIVGLASGDPDVRAFTIRDGQVAEADLDVE